MTFNVSVRVGFGRMAFQEHGTGEEVVKAVSQFIGATTLEIQVAGLRCLCMLCYGGWSFSFEIYKFVVFYTCRSGTLQSRSGTVRNMNQKVLGNLGQIGTFLLIRVSVLH